MPASAPASQLNAGRRVPGLTDPTFDPPGEYKLSYVTLKKVVGPALTATQVGSVDAVLVSHDQHADNFDRSGKTCALSAPRRPKDWRRGRV